MVQPLAGAGMGLQFIPRIGQQVLVDFFDDDLERPYVKGALYTGKGEGGVPATPGGVAAEADASVFAKSGDHAPGGQGNLAGGHAPAWHGASPGEIAAGGQRNAAALSGWKTKEFAGQWLQPAGVRRLQRPAAHAAREHPVRHAAQPRPPDPPGRQPPRQLQGAGLRAAHRCLRQRARCPGGAAQHLRHHPGRALGRQRGWRRAGGTAEDAGVDAEPGGQDARDGAAGSEHRQHEGRAEPPEREGSALAGAATRR